MDLGERETPFVIDATSGNFTPLRLLEDLLGRRVEIRRNSVHVEIGCRHVRFLLTGEVGLERISQPKKHPADNEHIVGTEVVKPALEDLSTLLTLTTISRPLADLRTLSIL